MPRYIATVLPGLENVLGDEIQAVIADTKRLKAERGKLSFTSSLPIEILHGLRTADNLYRFVGRFQVGPHKAHLADIEHAIAGMDLPCVPSLGQRDASYIVHASRKGKHTYSRFEAAEAAMRGLARQRLRCRAGTPEAHDIEFRLDIVQDEAVFSLRLTDAAFRYRRQGRAFSMAALRPTVAHALVRLSEPEADDVFLDPCCGSGTILAERAHYAARLILGGDVSEEAVAAARWNTDAGSSVSLHRWDARRLPLDSGSVTKAVTNLPFGRQIAAHEDIAVLYRELLREMNRVVAADGTILCLTDADEALQRAADGVMLRCAAITTLSLKGLHPTLYRLGKT